MQDVNDTSFVDNNTAVFPSSRHILLDDGSFPAPTPLAGKPGLSTSRNLYTDWTVVSAEVFYCYSFDCVFDILQGPF